jgi:hypothetical protein
MLDTTWGRWVIAAIVAVAIVALLAWARHDAGVDGRIPDPEDAIATVVVTDSGHIEV